MYYRQHGQFVQTFWVVRIIPQAVTMLRVTGFSTDLQYAVMVLLMPVLKIIKHQLYFYDIL